jgi:hypothetical protein
MTTLRRWLLKTHPLIQSTLISFLFIIFFNCRTDTVLPSAQVQSPYIVPKPKEKSSFVTLVAGIDPAESDPLSSRTSFLGYLLHLLVVRYVLDITNSTSDLNVLIRFRKLAETPRALTEAQENFFETLRMKLFYLPTEIRYDSPGYMMDKFYILRLQKYKQILFFDADVLPLCNWDFYFKLMDDGYLAPNLALAYKHEPAQGGFFIVTPEIGDWEKYRKMRFIDLERGFGTSLRQPAESLKVNYTTWSWQAASIDQGMLYHWVRYVKKSTSLAIGNRLQAWESGDDGNLKLVKDLHHYSLTCPNHIDITAEKWISRLPIYMDHIHYTGSKKPWQRSNFDLDCVHDNISMEHNRFTIWTFLLRKAWDKYEFGSLQSLFPKVHGSVAEDIHKLERFFSKPFCKYT